MVRAAPSFALAFASPMPATRLRSVDDALSAGIMPAVTLANASYAASWHRFPNRDAARVREMKSQGLGPRTSPRRTSLTGGSRAAFHAKTPGHGVLDVSAVEVDFEAGGNRAILP